MYYLDKISINPDIRFGKPCIKGTRISIYDILSWLASGISNENIIKDFPELTLDDIKASLYYAADKEKRISIA